MRGAMGGRGLTFLALYPVLIVTLVLVSSPLSRHPVVSAASPSTTTTGGGGGGDSQDHGDESNPSLTEHPVVSAASPSTTTTGGGGGGDSQDHGDESNPSLTEDGVRGCGVVAALVLAVSRAKLIQEVDIYRSVASIQQDRPQFIVNLEQYDFLHTALATYLSNNNHYGNFN